MAPERKGLLVVCLSPCHRSQLKASSNVQRYFGIMCLLFSTSTRISSPPHV
jgi:hypothetical protein